MVSAFNTILCPTCPHPIPQSPMDIWDIKGPPMVPAFNTIFCPTCPSHPSVPKGHMGHQGTSHGVPQQNSLSHLPIPFLTPQGTCGTSRDKWDKQVGQWQVPLPLEKGCPTFLMDSQWQCWTCVRTRSVLVSGLGFCLGLTTLS